MRAKLLSALATLFTSLTLPASAIDAAAVIAATSTGKTGDVHYRLFTPQKSEAPLPLVLCLHGSGGRGGDNTTQIRDTWWAPNVLVSPETQAEHPCFVLMPQCPKGKRWADHKWDQGTYDFTATPETAELAAVAALVKKMAAKPEIDASRIYVTGMSMGGYGTWDLLARYPDLFAAAIPICGGGDTSSAEQLKDVAIWVFHGAEDSVVPVTGSREMVAALKAVGAPVKYTEFPGVKHNSWQPCWKEKKLVPWLFAQSKD
ncbi:prolyl oligopeptidase family serine peptidase [Verrucomicrobiales bacterium]|nr:prolyl oligopeptidase family serine peptidase [Verrucomicrobiales bacterium]